MAAVAREWGVSRLWTATWRAVEDLLHDGAEPRRRPIWRRHLHQARERTVFEVHVERLVGPVAAAPLPTVPGAAARAIVNTVRPGPDEDWGDEADALAARAAQRVAPPLRPSGEEETDMTLKLRQDGVAWTDVDGEIVALDEATAEYLAANEAGGLLWRALAQGATRDELAARLAEEFGIERERALADTDAFVAALRARDLLEG